MKYRADITADIDLMDIFSSMCSIDQEDFIKEFLSFMEDEDLIQELEYRHYTVIEDRP